MKPAFPVFLALSTVWPALASSSGKAQTPPADTAPAVQLPSVTVTAKKDKANPIFGGNPLFDQPYADLRNGPMIDAILWRHTFLEKNPGEQAVIVTTRRGNRIMSATTIYTLAGKVYGSSTALGERVPITAITPAELGTAAGLTRVTDRIVGLRSAYLAAISPPLNPLDPQGDKEVAAADITVGTALVAAEESGQYRNISPGRAPTPTTPEGPHTRPHTLAESEEEQLAAQMPATFWQPFFPGPPDQILGWTYAALHDAGRAGIVPVILGQIRDRSGVGAAIPPFSIFHSRPPAPPLEGFIAFDWDGVQYYYHPGAGTWAKPLPVNAITGLPDLCIRNGALLESVYFCAVFAKQHPGSKPRLVPGDPVAAAYPLEGKLGLLIPTLGSFTLPARFLAALDNPESLGHIRDQVAAAEQAPGKAKEAIPEEMSGDDGGLQIRRAFLACQAAHLPCHLHEEGPPWFDFTWDGRTYVYGADQQIHAPNSSPGPVHPAVGGEPDFKVPAVEISNLPGPVIPDREPEIPELRPVPPALAPQPTAAEEASPAVARDKIVVLPPMVVATTRIAKNPWRYVSVPGFEILSRASDKATTWDLDGLRHGLWIQQAIIPKEWLPELPVPCTVIIDDTDLASIRADQPHSQKVAFKAPTDALAWGDLSGKARVSSEPVATDGDTFAINSNLHGVAIGGVTYASMNLDRLRLGAPPLPSWVIAGLLGRSGLFREGFAVVLSGGEGRRGGGGSGPIAGSLESVSEYAGSVSEDAAEARHIDRASGPGTLWISVAETQRLLQELKHNKNARIQMLPLAGLFAETPPAEPNRLLWESEAGLLLRWGLLGPGHDDPALSRGFLEIVRRARQEPVTETLFTACFGFGYAAMEARLETFLKTVLAQPTSVNHLAMPATFGLPVMKTATADQTGRMIGDWLRMQGDSLRSRDPAITAACLDSAAQMLLRAYCDDNALPADQSSAASVTAGLVQDPGLLAVFGLYEHDAGNDVKARGFLEAAEKAAVVRPQAHQVLAELRYAEAIAKPAGANGRISGSQAAAILEPLRTALRYPPSLDLYNLMVDTWGRCDAPVASGDIDILLAGVTHFPRSTTLAFKTALVCARNGYRGQAGELVRQGLLFATDAGDRNRFERLRSILENSPTTGVK